MSLKNLLQLFILLLLADAPQAQVKSVNYQLRFNQETNLFDCYLVVREGNAVTMRHRTQFNAQYTLLIPSGSRAELVRSYMPLQNNQNYNGIHPMEWMIANKIHRPAADPFHDYVSIVPKLSPASFYNDLKEGEEIRLFSVRVTPVTDCGESVKIYERGIDLHSGERGMYGGDFSNGFTIGGVEQKYSGNAPQVTPALNAVNHIAKDEKAGLRLSTILNPAFVTNSDLNYVWEGPNGFTSSDKDLFIPSLTSKHYGKYDLTVTDDRGCKENHSVEIKAPKKGVHNEDISISKSSSGGAQLDNREKPFIPADEEVSAVNVTHVRIYPNPAQNYFNIIIDTPAGNSVVADITDLNGRLIRKDVLRTTASLSGVDVSVPIHDIQPGLYNVMVKAGEEESVHKLIVVK